MELGATVVGPASSINKGLVLANSEDIDAAVLDVNIRSERVDPIAELLRDRHVPIVFATGYGTSAVGKVTEIGSGDRPENYFTCRMTLPSEIVGRSRSEVAQRSLRSTPVPARTLSSVPALSRQTETEKPPLAVRTQGKAYHKTVLRREYVFPLPLCFSLEDVHEFFCAFA